MNQIEIKIATHQEELKLIKAIRKSVFQEEQGVAQELEFDGLDEISIHLIAYLNNQPVGTSRIRNLDEPTAKIERLAVLPRARGQGIGKKLMEKALEIIANQNQEKIIIHAQEYIKNLYLQLGFEQKGETFIEAGIAHVKMIKQLKKA
jgi:predicted GNAT family N-acyltransferase